MTVILVDKLVHASLMYQIIYGLTHSWVTIGTVFVSVVQMHAALWIIIINCKPS